MTTVKVCLVGAGTTALDVLGVAAGHGLLGLPLWLAAAAAFLLSSVLHFVLHRAWVFASQGCPRSQAARYAGLLAGNLAVTAVGVPLLALGIDYRLAKLLVAALIGVGNLLVLQRWVFPRRRRPARRYLLPGALAAA